MNICDKVTVIIPSLNPDEKLIEVVKGVLSVGFTDIILINDGSKPECVKYFDMASELSGCTVLTHDINRGKGAGLKTAYKYILENRRDAIGVVAVDGDNQHKPQDILACSKKMAETGKVVFGVRDFSLPHVPKRSRFGNRMTSFVFRTGCGMKVSDTQTGLRAVPLKYIEYFVYTKGDRYEYETNMILDMGKYGIPLEEVKIETVYIDDNKSSHFRPVRDSIRIYKQILSYMLGSFMSFLIDIALFYIVMKIFDLTGYSLEIEAGLSILIATVISRLISSTFNFAFNKKLVFSCKSSFGRTLLKYYALCIPQMAFSWLLVSLIENIFSGKAGTITLIKLIVDTVLFFVSYQIQKRWVFRKDKEKKASEK